MNKLYKSGVRYINIQYDFRLPNYLVMPFGVEIQLNYINNVEAGSFEVCDV